jgi:CxxC motif-containing protein (DUF1111 family)
MASKNQSLIESLRKKVALTKGLASPASVALVLATLGLPACNGVTDGNTDEANIVAADSVKSRPAERVPRAEFGAVGSFPLGDSDLHGFIYPSASRQERDSLLPGLTFFTTPHTAAEGLGPVNNQKFCLGCHLNALESVDGAGLLKAGSQVARAARATLTNFEFTAFDPLTGGGHAADDIDALSGPGHTAAFTVYGDFNPMKGVFDDLKQFGGTVQHTRPSLIACLPQSIPLISSDPNLQGGTDPDTGESQTGFRRAVGERAGPPYIGRGLIEAIPEATILANEDPDDRYDHRSSLAYWVPRFPECPGDCISGRHNENTSNQAFEGGNPNPELGRFGLRAAGPTILQFVVGGVNVELGFTSPFKMTENLDFVNANNPACADTVPDPEVQASTVLSAQQLIRLTAPPEFGDKLVALLQSQDPAAPRRHGSTQEEVRRGAELFGVDLRAFANRMIPGRMPARGDGLDGHAIRQFDRGLNCVGCHTPVQLTGTSPAEVGGRLLSHVWAPIFSDILLHAGPEVTPERLASTPRDPVIISRKGFNTLDLPRNLSDDALPNQGLANGREFRTAPLMGMGIVGPPYLHDARVFLSALSVHSTPAGTVYSDSTVTNAPLVVRTLDDAIRAAIELHDLPAPDDRRTPVDGGCPVPGGLEIGDIKYGSKEDICPPYDSETSQRNRGEAREVIRRYRSLTPEDQKALIEFLKQL